VKILVIDDDRRLGQMLVTWLGSNGVTVEVRADGRTGKAALEQAGWDALVLDVMLPDTDGFEILRHLRSHPRPAVSGLPVLMLTARGDETDRVVGLELGADDYLPKPFSPRELLARLRAITRRARAVTEPDVLRFDDLEIDLGGRVVRLAGEDRPLTSYQFDILVALAKAAGRVLNRDQILDAVRGEPLEAFDRSIDVHVSRIRAAIGDDARNPRRIVTVRGVGYVFTRSPA